MTWVLVLTLIIPYGAEANHVFMVDGFTSEQRCRSAGDAWLKANEIRNSDGELRNVVRAVCMQK